MNTTLLLLLSGVLIGTGISLIWRDAHKKRRAAFVTQRDAQGETTAQADVEITISRPGQKEASTSSAAASPGGKPATEPAAAESLADVMLDARAVTQRWEALQSAFADALRQVNLVLAAAGVEVGPPGPPSRSINGGYGANCRLLIAGENAGSLRLQVTVHDQVHARVKSHGKEAAAINASSSAPAQGLGSGRASDLLSEVLKPAAAFALGKPPAVDPEQRTSGEAWQAVHSTVVAALDAAGGALSQAGSRFVTLEPPSWNAETRRHRMTVSIQVRQGEVARMHIERIGPEMEVAVGLPDASLMKLGRRRRIAISGMTTHSLAELIASCAWPAISHHTERQRAR
jgi:hypothetical protein